MLYPASDTSAICNMMYLPFVVLWVPIYILVPSDEVLTCWGASALSISLFVISYATGGSPPHFSSMQCMREPHRASPCLV